MPLARVLTGCPGRHALLARSILALPLELVAADEVVLVLELRAVAGLVQRHQQEDVPGRFTKPAFQIAVENSNPNSGGISSRE